MPFSIQSKMSDVLDLIPVSGAIQVGVGVGGHVKDAVLMSSDPH